MRGADVKQAAMFSYISPEQRVPADHPLRKVREITDRLLNELSGLFEQMYSKMGRPSIAPEKLLRALLLQVLYTIRSERMLIEPLDYKPFVPVVRGAEQGRCSVGPYGVHQEPRPASESRGSKAVLRFGGG
jgi:hypothetical protein